MSSWYTHELHLKEETFARRVESKIKMCLSLNSKSTLQATTVDCVRHLGGIEYTRKYQLWPTLKKLSV